VNSSGRPNLCSSGINGVWIYIQEDAHVSMRISELRKTAHEMGLSVDGSREMLIAAIKDNL